MTTDPWEDTLMADLAMQALGFHYCEDCDDFVAKSDDGGCQRCEDNYDGPDHVESGYCGPDRFRDYYEKYR